MVLIYKSRAGLVYLGLKDFFHRIQWIYIREREIHSNFIIKYLMQNKNVLKILLLLLLVLLLLLLLQVYSYLEQISNGQWKYEFISH